MKRKTEPPPELAPLAPILSEEPMLELPLPEPLDQPPPDQPPPPPKAPEPFLRRS